MSFNLQMRCIVIRLNDLLRFRTPHPNVGALPSFTHPNSLTLPKKMVFRISIFKVSNHVLECTGTFPWYVLVCKGGATALWIQQKLQNSDRLIRAASSLPWRLLWPSLEYLVLGEAKYKGTEKKKTTKSNTAGKRDCGSLCWHEWVKTDVASVLTTPKTLACLLKCLHMAMSRTGHQSRLNTVTSNFRVCDLTGNLVADARKSWKWLNSECIVCKIAKFFPDRFCLEVMPGKAERGRSAWRSSPGACSVGQFQRRG